MTSDEMKKVSDVVDAVIFPGDHSIIFCSYVPFLDGYKHFSCITDKEEVLNKKDP